MYKLGGFGVLFYYCSCYKVYHFITAIFNGCIHKKDNRIFAIIGICKIIVFGVKINPFGLIHVLYCVWTLLVSRGRPFRVTF